MKTEPGDQVLGDLPTLLPLVGGPSLLQTPVREASIPWHMQSPRFMRVLAILDGMNQVFEAHGFLRLMQVQTVNTFSKNWCSCQGIDDVLGGPQARAAKSHAERNGLDLPETSGFLFAGFFLSNSHKCRD